MVRVSASDLSKTPRGQTIFTTPHPSLAGGLTLMCFSKKTVFEVFVSFQKECPSLHRAGLRFFGPARTV